MISAFAKKVLLVTVTGLLVASSGCGPKSSGQSGTSSERLSATDLRAAEQLRLQTDELLRDVATGDVAGVRAMFPPDAKVDIVEQLRHYFAVDSDRFRIVRWEARGDVRLSPDRRTAQTFVVTSIQVAGRPAESKLVVFNWSCPDQTCQRYYLEPLKK